MALSSLKVARIAPSAFDALLAADPGFTRALLRHLARQSRAMTERIYEFAALAARNRLAAELLRLAAAGPGDGDVIRPAPTHFELASRIASHREAVSREMSRFARDGLVRKVDGRLEIIDPEGLRSLLPS